MSEVNAANLIHVAVFLGYMALLLMNAGNVRIPRMRMLSTLIQLSVVRHSLLVKLINTRSLELDHLVHQLSYHKD